MKEEMKEYLDMTRVVEMTAREFLLSFIGHCCYIDKFDFNSRILLDFIDKCKREGSYTIMLNDIDIKKSGGKKYSRNLTEAYKLLKLSLLIECDKDEVYINTKFLGEYNKTNSYFNYLMETFVVDYKEYEFYRMCGHRRLEY